MTRELLLLRHGKSDWNVDTDDFHRPLKDRGKRGAQRIGAWLAQQDLIPDLVVSSPAERALDTAEKCCKVMGIATSAIQQDNRIYRAEPDGILQVLADCAASAQRVMLVGHNPALETLLDYLADAPIEIPEDGKLLPTATLAHLAMSDDWRALHTGQATLVQLIRPSTLPKKFPFPSPNGDDLRDRPAYYYTQSSVIPYRINGGQLEILIVSSSQKKHWVVPKGIADPGHSLQDSASKEAWEEAGVEGEVTEEPLGKYTYEKWGAVCSVTVYPMAVARELPDDEWEERHRGRQWVSPQEAITRLKQAELAPIVVALEQRLN